MKLNKRIFISFMCMLFSLVSFSSVFAQEKEPEVNPHLVPCYTPVPVEHKAQTLEDYKKSLELLEEKYKQNKINKESYEQRKEALQHQIKSLEDTE